jgi:enamidase
VTTSPIIAIVGATVLEGSSLRPVEDATVIIEGGRIASIGASIQIPSDAYVYDAIGTTVLPGFIDAHVHIGFAQPVDVLRRGVTTVRDLAWPPADIFPLARMSREHGFTGPLILCAGPMITTPGGYPTGAGWAPRGTALEVRDTEGARAEVREIAANGAAVVKVALNAAAGPTLPFEILSAIVDEAHRLSLKVTAHVFGLAELDKGLAAGIDEIAHMLMSSQRIPDEMMDRMVASEMTVIPTMSIFFGRGRKIAIANLARFVERGGRVVYGTDLGNAGPEPGIDEREITAMAAAGLSPREVIFAGTVGAAQWLGLNNKGRLEVGLDADLIVVDGDPLTNIKDLTRIRHVVREGIVAL